MIIMATNSQLTVHLGSFLSPGSTSTHNSSQKGSSVVSIKQKSRLKLYMEKLQEHLIKAKAFTIKKWVSAWGYLEAGSTSLASAKGDMGRSDLSHQKCQQLRAEQNASPWYCFQKPLSNRMIHFYIRCTSKQTSSWYVIPGTRMSPTIQAVRSNWKVLRDMFTL